MVAHFCNPSNEAAEPKFSKRTGMGSTPPCDAAGMGRGGKGKREPYTGKRRKEDRQQEGKRSDIAVKTPLPHLGTSHSLDLSLGFLCSECFSFS